ncbi:hypothetical protein BABINDRAFT_163469 [Babjeviella inositovora NRRL Y-12698]|uniref:Sulfite efflux pump SSU1 n=1 Tax=Babjeviella inositovora NRRL Y-12698 TaxID=984486 RepID=A0A1E3QJ30_9ASCO|nr:uncharacterized protein BABINDRAFT_163469 [Babjeviella inositovora NRRL Y-12698]ODQ77454.1 hypothetical protein BABINDRAFT_163469 [Babjeviella inositovora NRRL Y-12698]
MPEKHAFFPYRISINGANLYSKFITNFHPAYFILNMGMGVTANILENDYPILRRFFYDVSLIFFVINVFVFIVLIAAFCIAIARNPWLRTRRWFINPSLAGFLGCLSMGFTTIINYIHAITGTKVIVFVYALWWINVVTSLFTCFVITSFYFVPPLDQNRETNKYANKITPQTLNSPLLLPVVPMMVVASAGNVIWPSLPAQLQFSTLLVTAMLWSVAMALAFMLMAIYLWKLYVYKFPVKCMVFTGFLPVGVLGQSSYGVLILGRNVFAFMTQESHKYLSIFMMEGLTNTPNAVLYLCWGLRYLTVFVSLFLMSLGFFFTFIALFSIAYYIMVSPQNNSITGWRWIAYHKGFWSMTFPLGTMALSLLENHKTFPHILFFKIAGLMYSLSLLFVVLGCMMGVVYEFPWRDLYRPYESAASGHDSDGKDELTMTSSDGTDHSGCQEERPAVTMV